MQPWGKPSSATVARACMLKMQGLLPFYDALGAPLQAGDALHSVPGGPWLCRTVIGDLELLPLCTLPLLLLCVFCGLLLLLLLPVCTGLSCTATTSWSSLSVWRWPTLKSHRMPSHHSRCVHTPPRSQLGSLGSYLYQCRPQHTTSSCNLALSRGLGSESSSRVIGVQWAPSVGCHAWPSGRWF